MSKKSFQEKFVESLGLNHDARPMENVTANKSSVNESLLSKFEKSMKEMEVEKSGMKMKKRKRSEDSGLDTSDYEVITVGQSANKRKFEEETETPSEKPEGKKKKKKKKKKGEKVEDSPVGEVDEPPVDTGSQPAVEKSQGTPNKEHDTTLEKSEGKRKEKKKKKKKKKGEKVELQDNSPIGEVDDPAVDTGSQSAVEIGQGTRNKENDTTSENSKNLLNNIEDEIIQESIQVETSLEKSEGKRKKKKKKKKGEKVDLQDGSPVGEDDEPPVDTGSQSAVENSQGTSNNDKTPIPKKKISLFSIKENEMFQESAEETDKPPETPGKKKKRKKRKSMEEEELQGEFEVSENKKPLVTIKMEEMKIETDMTDMVNPGLTINELYQMPKKSKVSAQIYSACQFIMEQEVEVSLLNRVYTGHCVPRERSFRKELRMKYNAKFGGYSLEQDEMILRRFRGLVDEVVTEGTAREFLQSVMETCNGENQQELHTSKFRTIAVRNIIGLYVGQVI